MNTKIGENLVKLTIIIVIGLCLSLTSCTNFTLISNSPTYSNQNKITNHGIKAQRLYEKRNK
jgi:hypothetical protein